MSSPPAAASTKSKGQPTYEEMEAKRQEMISSFKEIAAAMLHCVSVIEDYTRLTPTTLPDGKQPKPAKRKRERDPNAPKRPPSSFLMFSSQIRQEIKDHNPNATGKEILALISEKWKTLGAEEKQVFESAWANAHTEFKDADQTYKQNQVPVATTTVDPKTIQNALDKAAQEDDDVSDDDSSDEDSSDEDDAPPPAPVAPTPTPAAKPKSKGRPPKAAAAAAVVAPATPIADSTPTATKAKRERKRKGDGEPTAETPAAVTTPAVDDKKKKKKTAKE